MSYDSVIWSVTVGNADARAVGVGVGGEGFRH